MCEPLSKAELIDGAEISAKECFANCQRILMQVNRDVLSRFSYIEGYSASIHTPGSNTTMEWSGIQRATLPPWGRGRPSGTERTKAGGAFRGLNFGNIWTEFGSAHQVVFRARPSSGRSARTKSLVTMTATKLSCATVT